tara:strand:+ start:109 stop:582 length:474 start_codon:yes stop_codon:yes gene_type:complete
MVRAPTLLLEKSYVGFLFVDDVGGGGEISAISGFIVSIVNGLSEVLVELPISSVSVNEMSYAPSSRVSNVIVFNPILILCGVTGSVSIILLWLPLRGVNDASETVIPPDSEDVNENDGFWLLNPEIWVIIATIGPVVSIVKLGMVSVLELLPATSVV